MFKKIIVLVFCTLNLSCEIPKRAFITGVSRGAGHALAQNLLERGIHVVGVARADASNVIDLSKHQHFSYISADLAQAESFSTIKKFVAEHNYTFDYIVNNAAITAELKNLEKLNTKDTEEVININLIAPLKIAQMLLPHCNKNAKILNVSSRLAITELPQALLYCASKAGLNMANNVLKGELAEKNIAVATVIPGEIDSDMQAVLRTSPEFKLKERFINNYNNKKLITPALCAQFLSWLLCETSFEEFNSKKEMWDIYDASYHARWVNGVGPVSPV